MEDTIVAIATPLGEAALAIIRPSGDQSFAIADAVFQPVGRGSMQPSLAASHTIHYGRIMRSGRIVDEVMVAIFRAPRTFTREHVVEISCHGGVLAAKLILEVL